MRDFVRWIVSVLILCVAATQPAAGAQDSNTSPAVVLVYAHNLNESDSNRYAPVISGFITVELISRGISTYFEENALPVELGGGEEIPAIDALEPLLKLAEESGHKIVVLCAFDEIGTNIDLFFHVIDVDAGEITISIKKQSQPAIMIERAISRSVDLIMEKIADRIDVKQADRPVEEIKPAEETDAGAEKDVTAATGSTPALPPAAARIPDVPIRGFASSAGIGTIVFLGSSADYLRSGLTATVSVNYGLPFLIGRFDLGLYVGGFFVETQSAVTDGSVIISPAGIRLAYTSATGSFLDASFSLCGGISVFAARIEQKPYLVKTVPFIAGGPGFVAFAGSRISLQLEVLLNVFFEGQQAIVGYTPTLCILLR